MFYFNMEPQLYLLTYFATAERVYYAYAWKH